MGVFKVIIAGGRDFDNYDLLKSFCEKVLSNVSEEIEIVSGGATGADKMGINYGYENNYKCHLFLPNWEEYGRSAGVIRNDDMANFATALIAFWDGKSKGTKDMIERAKAKGLLIRICKYERV